MKGGAWFVLAFVAVAFISFAVGMFVSIPFLRYNLVSHIVTQIEMNKAEMALLTLLSLRENGGDYAELLAEKAMKNETMDLDKVFYEMGVECFRLYVKETNNVIDEMTCNDKEETYAAMTTIPLPNKKHLTLVLEVRV
ncbi:hypothetical protein DRP04_16080 [Archaeoglobales archaeon]|nr:MAG: hypothetical protein DRP04_16080 [Archaeoglobales archaeon]